MSEGYTKKEIIDAAVEALRPMTVQGGGYVMLLAARGLDEGPLNPDEGGIRTPAVIVSFGSSTYSPGQYMRLRETVGIEVKVIHTRGSGKDPEQALADIRSILCGSTLGLDIGPVMPVRETPLDAGIHRTAYSALYTVTQYVPAG